MSNTERTTPRYQLIALATLALALPALSCQGAVDDFALERVAEATRESVTLYGVSRGMNAIVSSLQASEVRIPFVSTSPGEMLDPVNDGIERLSTILVWSIGSLFIQRIILEAASSTIFKWILLASGLVALSLILPLVSERFRTFIPLSDRYLRRFIRIFVIAAVFRFIVPIFVGSSFLVSEALLQPALDRERSELTETEEEVSRRTDGRSPFEWVRDTAEMVRDVILERADDLLERIARVLAAVFVKNILFPILFLFVAMKCGGYVVKRATSLKLGSPANTS